MILRPWLLEENPHSTFLGKCLVALEDLFFFAAFAFCGGFFAWIGCSTMQHDRIEILRNSSRWNHIPKRQRDISVPQQKGGSKVRNGTVFLNFTVYRVFLFSDSCPIPLL